MARFGKPAFKQLFYEPGAGHGLRHNPFNSIISPRPIGWIGSQGKTGNINLAPYSFFNCLNYHPPIVGFSSIGFKDTVRNCTETGEFTWNLATRTLAEAVNTTCDPVDPEVNEFELAGLTMLPSNLVAPPRVGESPVHFECKVTQVEQLKNAEGGDLETYMVMGEVVGVHISEHLLVDGVYDAVSANPILRGGGPADYFTISRDNLFIMHRKHGHLEDPGVVDPPEGGEAAARQLMVAKDNLLALEAQLANAKAAVKDAQKAVASGNIEEEQ